MSHSVIIVENLGKLYRIQHQSNSYPTFRDALRRAATAPWRRFRQLSGRYSGNGDGQEAFWALKGVTFELMAGEVIGIIGRNGAGKSTLLKILSRITEPTTGRAILSGRVASLLEVGTGFHPELTGRENIYLNGAILGMKRAEISRKFEEIVAFAEVERFLDTPVKFYSSGMYVRLAFAVAAHLEPEILIVDEVLAVGDAGFQKKCIGKMQEVAQRQGRTVLFVSHNMSAVQVLCQRALLLKDGEVIRDTNARQAVSEYLMASARPRTESVWRDMDSAPGNARVRLRRACVRPAEGSLRTDMTVRTPLVLEFEYWNLDPGAALNLSVHILNHQGVMIFETYPAGEPDWHGKPFPAGLFRSQCFIPGDLLNDGTHRVNLVIVRDQTRVVFKYEDVLVFEVLDSDELRGAWHGKWGGAVRPYLQWNTQFVSELLLPAGLPSGAFVEAG